jgi:hypothetical protein
MDGGVFLPPAPPPEPAAAALQPTTGRLQPTRDISVYDGSPVALRCCLECDWGKKFEVLAYWGHIDQIAAAVLRARWHLCQLRNGSSRFVAVHGGLHCTTKEIQRPG